MPHMEIVMYKNRQEREVQRHEITNRALSAEALKCVNRNEGMERPTEPNGN